MHSRSFRSSAGRKPLALSLLSGVALAALPGCATIKTLEEHGLAASAFHGAYCEADEDRRALVEMMLVFEDGSPKLDIHCEPHRAEDEFEHAPRLQ